MKKNLIVIVIMLLFGAKNVMGMKEFTKKYEEQERRIAELGRLTGTIYGTACSVQNHINSGELNEAGERINTYLDEYDNRSSSQNRPISPIQSPQGLSDSQQKEKQGVKSWVKSFFLKPSQEASSSSLEDKESNSKSKKSKQTTKSASPSKTSESESPQLNTNNQSYHYDKDILFGRTSSQQGKKRGGLSALVRESKNFAEEARSLHSNISSGFSEEEEEASAVQGASDNENRKVAYDRLGKTAESAKNRRERESFYNKPSDYHIPTIMEATDRFNKNSKILNNSSQFLKGFAYLGGAGLMAGIGLWSYFKLSPDRSFRPWLAGISFVGCLTSSYFSIKNFSSYKFKEFKN